VDSPVFTPFRRGKESRVKLLGSSPKFVLVMPLDKLAAINRQERQERRDKNSKSFTEENKGNKA
jgi:hypothetical protein